MKSIAAVYLASKRDAAWMKWTRLDCLCASVYLLKKHVRPMPIIIFHEDYTEDDKKRLYAIDSNIIFDKVDFGGKEHLHVNLRPDNRVGSYGYCMMCRFFSGVLQNHQILKPFSHYMRLDDDSYIVSKLSDAELNRMLEYDYVYNSLFEDPCHSLWSFTQDFMRENNLGQTDYQSTVPYTNFHISSLALWNHPIVKKYADSIEATNGCLTQRWDDAQIGLMVAQLAQKLGLRVGVFDFPYRHNQQCCHKGSHTIYCKDGVNDQYPWGPPVL